MRRLIAERSDDIMADLHLTLLRIVYPDSGSPWSHAETAGTGGSLRSLLRRRMARMLRQTGCRLRCRPGILATALGLVSMALSVGILIGTQSASASVPYGVVGVT